MSNGFGVTCKKKITPKKKRRYEFQRKIKKIYNIKIRQILMLAAGKG